MLEHEHKCNHIKKSSVSSIHGQVMHIFITHCPCRIQDAPRRRWRGMPPRGHACAGGDRDGDAGPAQDSLTEAPRGSLCGCCCGDDDGGEKVEKKMVSPEQTGTRIERYHAEILSHVTGTNKNEAHQANRSIIPIHILARKSNSHSLISDHDEHAPNARAAPSDGLSGREGLAGIRRGTTVQRLSSAVLAATGTTATAALDVVIDAGGNPLGIVVALQGKGEGRHSCAGNTK